MRKFIITVLIALLSSPVLTQEWMSTENSFNKEYSRVTAYTWADSVWLYEGGNQFGWVFSYNIKLSTNSKSKKSSLGVVMRCEDSDRGDAFFFAFIKNIEEHDSEMQECLVGVFRKDRRKGWEFVAPGALRFIDDKVQVIFGDYRLDYTK
jgi:hypothetical protein